MDHHGEPWAGQKIGNGSTVNVNFAINEFGKGQKSANILSLQVWDLVKYDGVEFPVREDNAVAEGGWDQEVADQEAVS